MWPAGLVSSSRDRTRDCNVDGSCDLVVHMRRADVARNSQRINRRHPASNPLNG